MRISKVTTKVGDGGKTKLGNGKELSKSDLRIKGLGLVDELNSFIGHAKIATTETQLLEVLLNAQNQLLNLGGEMSLPDNDLILIKDESIELLEKAIHQLNEDLPPLKEFIIPGDDEFSARLHIARSVCRRVETVITEIVETESGRKIWIQYLNRLSDFLFVAARHHINQNQGVENQWERTE